ncbi:GNAT family N-acetyltransferase [Pseudogracilibacillus auburnensis]|uniref:GNAT family N-acetyltransferase n=1 Tax=Pseudogracilibacillus auburnensis TaxID=1494959 RepID=UPI001A96BCD0|nr:GNAT family N-acetyltransferase [Pseudogracilibacillus auburnensis]MBO1003091.1 GNAT family N-acetyltransferase [Pseudogracilibacillus auburnensis]
MLIRYKKNQEKIAMGLLSFMPVEKDVKLLQQTMKEYEDNQKWHLYLWKEDDDIVGTIGLKIEDELNVVIQHISVNPSYRNIGIGKKMIDEVQRLYGEKYDVCANELTQRFFHKCANNQSDDTDEE